MRHGHVAFALAVVAAALAACEDRYTIKLGCDTSDDCPEGYACSAGMCADHLCTDGIKEVGETGVDCGGECDPCTNVPLDCTSDSDCSSGHCVPAFCIFCSPPPMVCADFDLAPGASDLELILDLATSPATGDLASPDLAPTSPDLSAAPPPDLAPSTPPSDGGIPIGG